MIFLLYCHYRTSIPLYKSHTSLPISQNPCVDKRESESSKEPLVTVAIKRRALHFWVEIDTKCLDISTNGKDEQSRYWLKCLEDGLNYSGCLEWAVGGGPGGKTISIKRGMGTSGEIPS